MILASLVSIFYQKLNRQNPFAFWNTAFWLVCSTVRYVAHPDPGSLNKFRQIQFGGLFSSGNHQGLVSRTNPVGAIRG
jgi:hypothetical protein